MGLSRDTIPEITSLQVLLEIAQSLVALTNDPDILQKASERAYALPEAERQKAVQARADIANYQDLVAQNKRTLDDISDASDSLSAREVQLSADQKALTEYSAALQARGDAQDQRAIDFAVLQETLDARELVISSREQTSLARVLQLDQREASLTAYESALKDKASKFRDLTEGL